MMEFEHIANITCMLCHSQTTNRDCIMDVHVLYCTLEWMNTLNEYTVPLLSVNLNSSKQPLNGDTNNH